MGRVITPSVKFGTGAFSYRPMARRSAGGRKKQGVQELSFLMNTLAEQGVPITHEQRSSAIGNIMSSTEGRRATERSRQAADRRAQAAREQLTTDLGDAGGLGVDTGALMDTGLDGPLMSPAAALWASTQLDGALGAQPEEVAEETVLVQPRQRPAPVLATRGVPPVEDVVDVDAEYIESAPTEPSPGSARVRDMEGVTIPSWMHRTALTIDKRDGYPATRDGKPFDIESLSAEDRQSLEAARAEALAFSRRVADAMRRGATVGGDWLGRRPDSISQAHHLTEELARVLGPAEPSPPPAAVASSVAPGPTADARPPSQQALPRAPRHQAPIDAALQFGGIHPLVQEGLARGRRGEGTAHAGRRPLEFYEKMHLQERERAPFPSREEVSGSTLPVLAAWMQQARTPQEAQVVMDAVWDAPDVAPSGDLRDMFAQGHYGRAQSELMKYFKPAQPSKTSLAQELVDLSGDYYKSVQELQDVVVGDETLVADVAYKWAQLRDLIAKGDLRQLKLSRETAAYLRKLARRGKGGGQQKRRRRRELEAQQKQLKSAEAKLSNEERAAARDRDLALSRGNASSAAAAEAAELKSKLSGEDAVELAERRPRDYRAWSTERASNTKTFSPELYQAHLMSVAEEERVAALADARKAEAERAAAEKRATRARRERSAYQQQWSNSNQVLHQRVPDDELNTVLARNYVLLQDGSEGLRRLDDKFPPARPSASEQVERRMREREDAELERR